MTTPESDRVSSGQPEWTAEDEARERARIDAVFATGKCPYSGLPVHGCHRSICDCFDAWDCQTCGTTPARTLSPDLMELGEGMCGKAPSS